MGNKDNATIIKAVSLRITNDMKKKEENGKNKRGQDGGSRHSFLSVPGAPLRLVSFLCWEFVSESPTAVRGGSESLKGSHRMGDGRIFQKIPAPLSFIKAFLNESNFGRVHLAGQYL